MLAAADPAAELMQLRQAKAFRPLNQHHIGVRHINAHFHHRRRYQNIQRPVPKLAHNLILVRRRHPPVQQGQAQFWKDFLGQSGVFLRGGLGRDAVRFVNQGMDDKGLPPLLDMPGDEAIDRPPPFRIEPAGKDFLAARRQFIQGGQVQVAIQGQGQGAGYRGSGHNQGVRIFLAFLPQGKTLHYAETMLFIHYRQSQVGHIYAVLNQGVGADKQVQVALRRYAVQLAAGPGADAAGQQAHGYRAAQGGAVGGKDVVFLSGRPHSAQQIADGLKMLLGQHFGRHHYGPLITGGDDS